LSIVQPSAATSTFADDLPYNFHRIRVRKNFVGCYLVASMPNRHVDDGSDELFWPMKPIRGRTKNLTKLIFDRRDVFA